MFAAQSLWIVISALMFALMSICIKYGAEHATLLEIAFYRAAAGCMMVAAIARFRAGVLRTGNFGAHFRRSVFGYISLLSFFYAITRLPLSIAQALMQTSPIFLTLLSAALMRERPGVIQTIALAASFVGVLLVLQPQDGDLSLFDGGIGLLSGIAAGAAYYTIRQLGKLQEGGVRTVFYFTLLSTVFSAALLALTGDTSPYSHEKALWVMGVAVCATGGQLTLTRGLHYGKSVVSSALIYTGILFTGALDYLLWGSVPNALAWVGIFVIFVAGVTVLSVNKSQ